jgi:hypothetical protein
VAGLSVPGIFPAVTEGHAPSAAKVNAMPTTPVAIIMNIILLTRRMAELSYWLTARIEANLMPARDA